MMRRQTPMCNHIAASHINTSKRDVFITLMNVLFTQNTYIKRHLKIEQLFMNLHTTNIRSRYCLLYARNVI